MDMGQGMLGVSRGHVNWQSVTSVRWNKGGSQPADDCIFLLIIYLFLLLICAFIFNSGHTTPQEIYY
jgi:hypothetical protein